MLVRESNNWRKPYELYEEVHDANGVLAGTILRFYSDDYPPVNQSLEYIDMMEALHVGGEKSPIGRYLFTELYTKYSFPVIFMAFIRDFLSHQGRDTSFRTMLLTANLVLADQYYQLRFHEYDSPESSAHQDRLNSISKYLEELMIYIEQHPEYYTHELMDSAR